MADTPKKKMEVCLRGDVGVKWKLGVGQFEEPVPPVKPTELDGTKLPVHLYLDEEKIGPTAAVAPEQNDDNNQVQISKSMKKPIKWYVKVPGGGGEHHHDDYSYHSPPWSNGQGSSGSSSPPYGSTPSEDGSSGGQSSPAPTGRDPSGGLYVGELDPSPITNAPTQQVQFGGAPPASPGLTQRFNVYPKRTALNPIALRTFRKLRGITNLEIELILKPETVPTAGETIELNITLAPLVDMAAPTDIYRAAVVIDETWSSDWTRVVVPFRGFPADQEFPITYALERRSDVSPNFDTEVWVMQTIIRGVN